MEDFKTSLQQEFVRRASRNAKYSLRAFAASLDISHATLSGILSGKRPISKATIKKLAPALGLGPKQIEKLTSANKAKKHFVQLQQDVFNSIADWSFDGILELSKIPFVDMAPGGISKVLGISEMQAKFAIETLLRLQMLSRSEAGLISITYPDSTNILDPDSTSVAQINYQKSVLEKSLNALETLDRKRRDHTSTTISMNKKDLPEAKKRIQKFRHELNTYLQRKSISPDEVYQLQVSFFPLTNFDNKGSQK